MCSDRYWSSIKIIRLNITFSSLVSTMGRSLVRNDYLHCNTKWYIDLAFPTLLSTISNVMHNQKEFEEIKAPEF